MHRISRTLFFCFWAVLCAVMGAGVMSSSRVLADQVLTRSTIGEFGSLDPHKITSAAELPVVIELFEGLTTVDPLFLHGVPIYTEEERAQRLAKPHYDQTPREDGSHLLDRWNLLNPKTDNPATIEAFHWSIVHFFWAGANEWYGHHAAFSYDLETDFKALTVPTVVISNSGDGLHSKMPTLKALRPDFNYASLDGGNLGIMVDEPERWASLVADLVHGTMS